MRRTVLAVLLILAVTSCAVAGYFILGAPRAPDLRRTYPAAPHSNMSIGAVSDLTKPGAGSGCECVRSGSGQEQDPYLISDWIVNSTMLDGIIISETSAHIVVARVELHGASLDRNGLYFYNVANVIVRDCRISGYLNGISAFGSSNLEFTNNTVTRNGYGIVLETSDSNKLIANRFDGNTEIGIFVRASSNLVKDNSATGNGFGGINVDGTAGPANENQLEGNIVSDNEVYGIGVWRGGHNVLKQNKVTHNKIVGIMLTDQSTNNTIEANIVSNNTGSGITLIDGSSGNTIRGNMARGNGDGINYFDLYDAVLGNIWQNNTYDTKKPESIG